MPKATGPLYKVAYRRRRENRTNYEKRLGQIKAATPRLVVRTSNRGIRVQFVDFEQGGDLTRAQAVSGELDEMGWLSQSNTPTAYLVGLMAGMRAKKAKISGFHLDIGIHTPSKGRILFAAAMGAKAAGLEADIPEGEDAMVSEDRIKGEHIAEYAKTLKTSDHAKFGKLFSRYAAKNIDVTALPALFEKTKQRVASG